MRTFETDTGREHPTPHRRVWRRLERFLVGIGMSLVAWPLERLVLRSARRG